MRGKKLVKNLLLYFEIEKTTRRNNSKTRLYKYLDKERQQQEESPTSISIQQRQTKKMAAPGNIGGIGIKVLMNTRLARFITSTQYTC